MSKQNPSPAPALGISMYQTAATEANKARKAKRQQAKTGQVDRDQDGELKGGILNGTEWSKDEGRDTLYDFAKAEGVKVKSRATKAAIIKALSAATKAQA